MGCIKIFSNQKLHKHKNGKRLSGTQTGAKMGEMGDQSRKIPRHNWSPDGFGKTKKTAGNEEGSTTATTIRQ